jgi:hypothetical protein
MRAARWADRRSALDGSTTVHGRRPEAEARVVVGVSEEDDQGFIECVGGAEDSVHEGAAHTPVLMALPGAE